MIMNNVKVTYVAWSDSFSMGVKQLDEQRKELLAFVDGLLHPIADSKEEASFWDTIRQAEQYVKDHFATEDKYMLLTRFPGYNEHKNAHDQFVQTIADNMKCLKAGETPIPEKFISFMKNWMLSHIAIMDKRYSDYFWNITAF